MKIEFSEEKNTILKSKRWVSFEDVIYAINQWNVLDIIQNDNYPNQKNLVLKINDYVYICPFIKDNNIFFLKTLFPSRKHNKIYNS